MRLRQLDFLRGIAILLVIFGHYALADILNQIGWVGVDLFFVLSGFLVSGLLFSEYKKYGDVNPKLFLIRRGFKIYPLFYTFMLLTLIIGPLFYYIGWSDENIFRKGLISEFIFTQNYLGRIWDHTWSLAVEEHFYFSLAILIFFLTKKNLLRKKVIICIAVFVATACLLLRIINNVYHPIYNGYSHLFPRISG